MALIKNPIRLVCCLLLSLTSLTIAATNLDRVVVIVNEDVILQSELDKAERLARLQNNPLNRTELLEAMVLERVQLDLAKRLNIYVSKEEEEEYIQTLLAQNSMTSEQYEQELLARGISYAEWRQEIYNSLLLSRLQQQQLRTYIRINEDEVDDFLLDNLPRLFASTRYDLVHILIPTEEASQTEVEALVAQLGDISSRAKINNEIALLPFVGLQTNDLTYSGVGELPELFIREVPLMGTGDARYFRSGTSWHIVKAMAVSYPTTQYRTEYRLASISLLRNVLYTEAQLKVRVDSVYNLLLNGRDFRELAQTYSDSNSLLTNYGLDWVGLDVLPPKVSAQVVGLEVGKFSSPFLLENGWYIILVEDERERDITIDLLREQAYRVLANRKLTQSLPFWLNDILSQAYVNYLPLD